MKYDSKTCVIWDSCEKKTSGISSCIYWGLGSKKNDLSIQEIVEKQDNKYKSKYLSFIDSLGKVQIGSKNLLSYLDVGYSTSFWWMTTISEKCNYSKSPYIEDIVKLMAFSDWIQGQDYERYILVSSNVALSKSIGLLLRRQNVRFQYIKSSRKKEIGRKKVMRFFKKMPYIVQSFFSIIKNISNGFLLKGMAKEDWRKTKAKITFVSYSCNMMPESVNSGSFSSYYWGGLTDLLKSKSIETNWLHIYVKDNLLNGATQLKKTIKQFNLNEKKVRNHVVLQSFVDMKVILELFSTWFSLLFKYPIFKKTIQSQAGYFWPLLSDDVKQSILGPNAIHNIFFQSLFNRVFSLLPMQDSCYYLQENQGWESGMINAYRQSQHRNIIGVPHVAMKYWDLRHYHSSLSLKGKERYPKPLPDKVALNGDAALKLYLDSGYSQEKIVRVEALRYIHLGCYGDFTVEDKVGYNTKNLLVLGDYLPENTFNQLEILKMALKDSNSKFNIFFKPHPHCRMDMTEFSDLNMKIVNSPVADLISMYKTVYASNRTSASVEAYYARCVVVSFLEKNKLNSSPLRGVEGVYFASTPQEVLHGIDKITGVLPNESSSNYFYLDDDLPLWNECLKDNTLSA
jgi:surface carbohydrate biosynthesis protein (TIGR04326 family)